MNDVIRRQDAIEATHKAIIDFFEVCEEVTCFDKKLLEVNKAITTRIKNIPSAQQEIIRCKDCKWFGEAGCAVQIVYDSDKPTEDDYCSFAERRTDE